MPSTLPTVWRHLLFFYSSCQVTSCWAFCGSTLLQGEEDYELSSRNLQTEGQHFADLFVCQFQRLEKVKVKVFQSHHGFQGGKLDVSTSGGALVFQKFPPFCCGQFHEFLDLVLASRIVFFTIMR